MKKRIAFRGPPYNWPYMLTHPWEIVFWVWNEIYWFVQRGLYGYADCDWWGLNGYLVTWLPSALRKLARGYGYPADMTMEAWAEMLNKAADGIDEGRNYLDHPWDYKYPPKEFNLAMLIISTRFWDLWD